MTFIWGSNKETNKTFVWSRFTFLFMIFFNTKHDTFKLRKHYIWKILYTIQTHRAVVGCLGFHSAGTGGGGGRVKDQLSTSWYSRSWSSCRPPFCFPSGTGAAPWFPLRVTPQSFWRFLKKSFRRCRWCFIIYLPDLWEGIGRFWYQELPPLLPSFPFLPPPVFLPGFSLLPLLMLLSVTLQHHQRTQKIRMCFLRRA